MTFLRRIRVVVGLSLEASFGMSVVVVAVAVLALLSMLLVAVALKLLVDATIDHSTRGVVIGAVVAALALTASVGWLPLAASLSLRLQERIQTTLDRRLMTLTAELPTLEERDSPQFAETLQLLLTSDRFPLAGGLVTLASVLGFLGLLTTACVFMGLQHPLLALVPVAVLPLLWVGFRADQAWDRARQTIAGDQQHSQELYRIATTPEAGKELRVFDLGDVLLSRHAAAEDRVRRVLNRAGLRSALIRSVSWLLFTGGYVAAVLVVTERAIDHRASAGDVVLVITLALPIVLLAGTAGPYLSVLSQLSAAAGRLSWIGAIAARSTAPAANSRPAPTRLAHGISLVDVSLTYPSATAPALQEITLDIPAGSVVALVGDNGAGKSTLVKLLCGLYHPTRGQILIDGVDARDIDNEQWRARICAGFQDFVHFEFLARDSVGVGDVPRQLDARALDAAVTRGGAGDVITTLAQGLDTQLGRTWTDGAELSLGQWQKIALSRGLMRDKPLLVVLDEPTAALDPAAEEQLFRRFAETAQSARASGTITVLVSHRFSTVRFADLIAVVDDGRITELGSHQELIARSGTYAELFELQSRHYR